MKGMCMNGEWMPCQSVPHHSDSLCEFGCIDLCNVLGWRLFYDADRFLFNSYIRISPDFQCSNTVQQSFHSFSHRCVYCIYYCICLLAGTNTQLLVSCQLCYSTVFEMLEIKNGSAWFRMEENLMKSQ